MEEQTYFKITGIDGIPTINGCSINGWDLYQYPAYQRYMFRWNFVNNSAGNAFQLDEVALNVENGSQILGYTYVTANPNTGYGTTGTTSWQGPQRMVDGVIEDGASKWCCGANYLTTAYLVFDATKPLHASSYSIYAAGDTNTFTARRPHEVYLYGTNDLSVTAVTSDKWNLVSYSPQARLTIVNYGEDIKPCIPKATSAKKYQYFQWRFIPNSAGTPQIQMEELSLIDKTSGELIGSNYFVAQSYRNGTLFGDGAIANLFDGNTATKFGENTNAATTGGIMFSAKMPIEVSGIGLQIGNDTNNAKHRNPVSWSLLASETPTNDWESDNWKVLYLSNSALPTTNYQWCHFKTYEGV